jgi:chromosome segregation ATPase
MNISNDSPAVDYVKYFTEQFPRDLAQMATLRDELAVRQGAISAAKDAISDREAAKAELTEAKTVLSNANAEAKFLLDAANDKTVAAETKEKELNAETKKLNSALVEREKTIDRLEAEYNTKLDSLTKQQNAANIRSVQLNEQEATLQNRVKAFQDKVAALNA